MSLSGKGVHAVLLMVPVHFERNEPSTGDVVACLMTFSVDVTVEQELHDGQWFGPMLEGRVQWNVALKPNTRCFQPGHTLLITKVAGMSFCKGCGVLTEATHLNSSGERRVKHPETNNFKLQ